MGFSFWGGSYTSRYIRRHLQVKKTSGLGWMKGDAHTTGGQKVHEAFYGNMGCAL